ncbi:hypothetical protein QN277_021327 [Acacia crassicarpa]|uniref:Uncharacterized protein n=1 Tax=Acacia crassicarpa TaxID=499986 RepID=A0AAE1KEE5_9FABA|nr:hypothetical protein QN277_021327 [Acacia crassicarpa]
MESLMKPPAHGYSYNILDLVLPEKVTISVHHVLRRRPGSQTQNHARFNVLHDFVGRDFFKSSCVRITREGDRVAPSLLVEGAPSPLVDNPSIAITTSGQSLHRRLHHI